MARVFTKMVFGFTLSSVVMMSYASHLFSGSVTVTNPGGEKTTYTLAYNSIQDAANAFSTGELKARFGENAFNNAEAISGQVSLRGLETNFTVANPGKSDEVITLNIPGVVNEKFAATSAKSADTQLKEWLKGQDGSSIDKVLKAMVSQTAFDPVGGNPTSLMAQLSDYAFDLGDGAVPTQALSQNIGLYSIAPHYERYSLGKDAVQMLALPMSYTRYFRQGKTAFLLDLPMYVTKVDNSYTYSAALGLGLKQQLAHWWSLTPSVYVGGTGSMDLGSATLVYSGNLKSRFLFHPWTRWYFGVSNMASYEQTQDLKIADYNIKYGLKNWLYTNGVDTTYVFGAQHLALKLYARNTQIAGSHWYISEYSTVGLSVIKKATESHLLYSEYSLGVSYLFAQHGFNGLNVNASMTF